LEAEYYTPDIDQESGVFDKLKNIEEGITQINTKISDLTDNMREMVEKIK
jgi:regulator of replication initiation timing